MIINIDESGQINLPKIFLKELDMPKGGPVMIGMDYHVNGIVIKRLYPGCFFCDCAVDLIQINNKYIYICVHCIDKLKNAKIGDNIYISKIE